MANELLHKNDPETFQILVNQLKQFSESIIHEKEDNNKKIIHECNEQSCIIFAEGKYINDNNVLMLLNNLQKIQSQHFFI